MDEREQMYDEVPREVANAPVPDTDTNPNELDPQLAAILLAVGAAVVDASLRGDVEGLKAFVNEIERAVQRNRALEKLMGMEADELEKVLGAIQAQGESVPEEKPAPAPAEAPPPEPSAPSAETEQRAVESQLYSPRGGGSRNSKGKTLHDYVGLTGG
jgi:hypothetical protein